jgi:hypothetical protein
MIGTKYRVGMVSMWMLAFYAPLFAPHLQGFPVDFLEMVSRASPPFLFALWIGLYLRGDIITKREADQRRADEKIERETERAAAKFAYESMRESLLTRIQEKDLQIQHRDQQIENLTKVAAEGNTINRRLLKLLDHPEKTPS